MTKDPVHLRRAFPKQMEGLGMWPVTRTSPYSFNKDSLRPFHRPGLRAHEARPWAKRMTTASPMVLLASIAPVRWKKRWLWVASESNLLNPNRFVSWRHLWEFSSHAIYDPGKCRPHTLMQRCNWMIKKSKYLPLGPVRSLTACLKNGILYSHEKGKAALAFLC